MGTGNVSRISIGGFFTVEPTDALITANVQQDHYDIGDTITTLFDTTGGREVEMGLFGGIENGLKIKVNEYHNISDDDLRVTCEGQRKEGEFQVLAYRPGILVLSRDYEQEGQWINGYLVITKKAMLSGYVLGRIPKAEKEHYDRIFASAAPVEKTTSARQEDGAAMKQDQKNMTADELENRVLKVLQEMACPLSAQEIRGLDEALEAFTDLKISFVLNSMIGTRVKKEYVGGTFKFSLL